MRSRSVSALCVAAVLALAGARAVFAQYGHPPEAPGSTKITAQLVRTGLYKITGGGSNSLLRLSANGLILVDGKLAGNYEALLKQVRKIVDQPVRALVLTSDSEDRTGNNAKFLAAGTQIIAQRNLMHLTRPRSGTTEHTRCDWAASKRGYCTSAAHIRTAIQWCTFRTCAWSRSAIYTAQLPSQTYRLVEAWRAGAWRWPNF